MTKDEFTSLPAAVALGVLYDMFGADLASEPVPQTPRPPKYDAKLARKGGFNWMSEMNLESLQYWHGVKSEGARSGGQYAEKDDKVAKQLAFWIEWRKCEPSSPWRGTRGNSEVTAPAPIGKPDVHPWEPRGDSAPPPENSSYDPEAEDDFPF